MRSMTLEFWVMTIFDLGQKETPGRNPPGPILGARHVGGLYLDPNWISVFHPGPEPSGERFNGSRQQTDELKGHSPGHLTSLKPPTVASGFIVTGQLPNSSQLFSGSNSFFPLFFWVAVPLKWSFPKRVLFFPGSLNN